MWFVIVFLFNGARRRDVQGQQLFCSMPGPRLQPPIHVNMRSPTGLAIFIAELGVPVEHLLGGA